MTRRPRPPVDPDDPQLAAVRALVRATPPEVLDRIRGRAAWRRAVQAAWRPLALVVAALALATTTPPGLPSGAASGWLALGLVLLGLSNRVLGVIMCPPKR